MQENNDDLEEHLKDEDNQETNPRVPSQHERRESHKQGSPETQEHPSKQSGAAPKYQQARPKNNGV